jgi:diguanylate cyclase (GGDEF)-like protein
MACLLHASTFAHLDRACREVVEEAFAQPAAKHCALVCLHDESSSYGYIINKENLHKQRHYRPYPLDDPLIRAIGAKSIKPTLFDVAPAALLVPQPQQQPLLDATSPFSLLIPFHGEGKCRGGLLIGLAEELDPQKSELAGWLTQLGATLGAVVVKIRQHELMACQNQQLRQLHDVMLKGLLAADQKSMLSMFLNFLSRYLGFSRTFIALVHDESQTLRSELHTGFHSSFVPYSKLLSDEEDLFIQWARDRTVRLFEPHCGLAPGDLPAFYPLQHVERVAIIPLWVGDRLVGCIYADQPYHDGSPIFTNVLEGFAQLASAAIANLQRRVWAEHLAATDALTGLNNRYFLDRVLQLEIPRVKRYNHPISLMMIDLWDFKHTNDTYGHQFGDYILRETANLLEANVRQPDIVVRYGGDEFVVLMVNTANEQARLVRNRIERAFIERNRLQTDERMMINISIGLRSADAKSNEALLDEADQAMYANKAFQTRASLLRALIAGNLERIEAADRIVGSLCNILYNKEPIYVDHARRVAHMAIKVGRRLGLSDDELHNLALAALLHDVGKVSMPTEVLRREAPLTSGEMTAMRHHPALGEEFFQGVAHLEPIRPIIRAHHERYDGLGEGPFPGYPDGLRGEAIPLAARILKLAESVDCMLTDRPYRKGSDPEKVRQMIQEEADKSFDRNLTRLLLGERDWHTALGEPKALTRLLKLDPEHV